MEATGRVPVKPGSGVFSLGESLVVLDDFDVDILVVARLDVARVALGRQFPGSNTQPLLPAARCRNFVGFEMDFGIGHDRLLFTQVKRTSTATVALD
jgi:hypothetical protein